MRDDVAVVLDPVADGKPSFSRVTVLGIAALLGIAGWYAYTGVYDEVVTNVIIAGLLYLVERTRTVSWMNGYKSAALSIHEQAGVDDAGD